MKRNQFFLIRFFKSIIYRIRKFFNCLPQFDIEDKVITKMSRQICQAEDNEILEFLKSLK
jgi:hypothetical protein